MTHIIEHDARSGGRLQHPEGRFDRRRRAVADWGADDVFHAPDRHGGREARNPSRFADRWNAQHVAAPASSDPFDDWLPAEATPAGTVHEWDGTPQATMELADDVTGPDAQWADDPYDPSELDTAELAAEWNGRGPFAPAAAPRVSARDAALLDEWDPRPAPSVRATADRLAPPSAERPHAAAMASGASASRRKRRPADDWLAEVPIKRPEPIVQPGSETGDDAFDGADDAAAALAPTADDEMVPNGRRTIVVRGRPDAVADSRMIVPATRGSDMGFERHWVSRPDRIAAWAAFLGFLLILVAVVTAQA